MATIVLLASFLGSGVSSEVVQCGSPGRPVNGTSAPVGPAYFPGEKILYGCLEGFVLFGSEERTCLKNGTWSASVPLCDFNLARGKKSLQSATLWSYSPDLAVDGNSDTCSFTPRSTDGERWWQVHLGHKFNVVTIGVTISPGSVQEFTIFVIELLADNKALYKQCANFKGIFQSHKGLFKCNDGLGHPGQFVYIRDDRKAQEYFGLCEIEVFAFRERIPCGDPEAPFRGEVKRESEEVAIYSCNVGATLSGNKRVTCSSKGKWQGHVPKCLEVTCASTPSIPNGYVELSQSKTEHIYGTEAIYGCSPGFILRGNKVRVCSHDGKWLGEEPSCQAVTCGEPPSVLNAHYTILNDSRHWNGIAIYACNEGYDMLKDAKDSVTTCQDTGRWRNINLTCVPSHLVFEGSRLQRGRSLNYELSSDPSASYSNSFVVTTLAAIAGTLATIMLIIVILLLRKKLLGRNRSNMPIKMSVDKGESFAEGSNSKLDGNAAVCIDDCSLQQCGSSALSPVTQLDYMRDLVQADRRSADSVNGSESSYERVGPKSEHSYETLGKKNFSTVVDVLPDESYESVTASDRDSIGYEFVLNGKEPGYETLIGIKDSFENGKAKDHQYETLKEKGAPYETVKGEQEPGYEVVREEPKSMHGYETLKPKLPLPKDDDSLTNDSLGEIVPDLLQNLRRGISLEETDGNGQEVVSAATQSAIKATDVKQRFNDDEVPPEVLALYARVDKSKKKVKKKKSLTASKSSDTSSSTKEFDNHKTVKTKLSKLPSGAKDLIRKFNSASSDDHRSISPVVSDSSSVGTLRPLPPLPQQ